MTASSSNRKTTYDRSGQIHGDQLETSSIDHTKSHSALFFLLSHAVFPRTQTNIFLLIPPNHHRQTPPTPSPSPLPRRNRYQSPHAHPSKTSCYQIRLNSFRSLCNTPGSSFNTIHGPSEMIKYRLVCRQKNNFNRIAHILEGLRHFLCSSL